MYAVPVPIIVPRFDFRIEVGVKTDIGRYRGEQQDAFAVETESALFLVADGMGGHPAGEVASELAVKEVQAAICATRSTRVMDAYVNSPSLALRRRVFSVLRNAMVRGNAAIRRAAAADPERKGMGTTLDVVWLARDHAFVAHCGDGRVYLARSTAVIQLTQDHAEAEELKATGALLNTSHQSGGRLMNALGLSDRLSVDTLFVDLSRGNRILLCTDGVHSQLRSEAMLSELLRSGTATGAAEALVARAGQKGRDNATAVVIGIVDRFVSRAGSDKGLSASDLERARSTPLLSGAPEALVLATLAAAVEVELAEGATAPRVVASDLVCYIILDGVVSVGSLQIGVGGLLFPESLVGVSIRDEFPKVSQAARLLRLRQDDFAEVCAADDGLAAQLFRRLATHIARARQRDVASVHPEPDNSDSSADR